MDCRPFGTENPVLATLAILQGLTTLAMDCRPFGAEIPIQGLTTLAMDCRPYGAGSHRLYVGLFWKNGLAWETMRCVFSTTIAPKR